MPIRNLILVPVLAALVAPAISQTTGSNPAIPAAKPVVAVAAPQAVVPALIPFSGIALKGDGKPLSGEAGVTFLIYKEQQGGEPLWAETQTVALDAAGRYKAQLGATTAAGLPMELFAAGDARWLEVQVAGQKPEPRIMLISVPYALKAADAETLGGLPASAFALANPAQASTGAATPAGPRSANHENASSKTTPANPDVTGAGTTGYVPLWDSKSDIASSILFQTGSGSLANIGINTTTPVATLDVYGTVNASTGFNLRGHEFAFGDFDRSNAYLGFAGNSVSSGVGNTAIGQLALQSNRLGGSNTAAGDQALGKNDGGNFNSAFGEGALYLNTGGSYNSALGFNAGPTAPNLTNATAIGAKADVTASNSLVLGSILGVNGCTAANKCSSVNVGIGTTAPQFSLDVYGTVNASTGFNLRGHEFAFGDFDRSNAYLGFAGNSVSSGVGNTAIGQLALQSNGLGGSNTAAGDQALGKNDGGNFNSAFGEGALYLNTGGSYNSALGFNAGPTAPNLTNATAIGAKANVAASNSLVLGSILGVNGCTAANNCSSVKVGIGTDAPVTTLDVEAPVGTVPTIRFGSLKIPAVFAVNGDTFLGGALAVGEGTKVMSVAHDGIITFAPGQTFPGTGSITGVTTTSPLTSSESSSGSVALGLNTSALENTLNGAYAQLGAANTFSMYQQMNGGMGVSGLLNAGIVSATGNFSENSTITGANSATSGFSNGGYFSSASPGGAAVIGLNASGGPAGLFAGPVTLEGNSVATAIKATSSSPLSLMAQAYSSQSGGQLVNQTFQWQAVPVAMTNNTASPSTTLNLLYGSGTNAVPATPTATGFSINSDGTLNFAGNQSFPITGTGGGTITGITTSSPLTGNGTSGSVALGLNTSALANTLNLQNYAQLGAVNNFTMPQNVMANMSVTGTLTAWNVAATEVNSGLNAISGSNTNTTGMSNGGYFSSASPAGTGVVGLNSAGGYAGFFQGNVGVIQGNVSVANATTTGQLGIGGDPVMSHNPHMVFSGYLLGDLNGQYGLGITGGFFVPDENITITRISANIQSPGTGCNTDATVDIYAGSHLLASLELGQDIAMADSGPLSPPVSVAAGTQLQIASVGASGCNLTGGSPNNVFVNVQYVMQ